MKVTITNKGDGFIALRLDATTNIEHMIMAVAKAELTVIDGCSISLDASNGRPKISVGYLSIPALEIVKDAAPAK